MKHGRVNARYALHSSVLIKSVWLVNEWTHDVSYVMRVNFYRLIYYSTFFFFCKHLNSQCRVFVPITVLIVILCNIIFDTFLAINVFSVGKFICARSDNDIKLEWKYERVKKNVQINLFQLGILYWVIYTISDTICLS